MKLTNYFIEFKSVPQAVGPKKKENKKTYRYETKGQTKQTHNLLH